MPKRRTVDSGTFASLPRGEGAKFASDPNIETAASGRKMKGDTGIARLIEQLDTERHLRVGERAWQIAQLAAMLLPKIHEDLTDEERRKSIPSVIEDAEFLLEAARLRSAGLWAHQLFEGYQSEMLTAGQIAGVFKAHRWRGWMEDNTVRSRIEALVSHFVRFGHNPMSGREYFRALGLDATEWMPARWIVRESNGGKSVTKFAAHSILHAAYLVGTPEQKALVRKPIKPA